MENGRNGQAAQAEEKPEKRMEAMPAEQAEKPEAVYGTKNIRMMTAAMPISTCLSSRYRLEKKSGMVMEFRQR